jgi:preprotein translocase subunit SecG
MLVFIVVITSIVCVLLTLVVLIQNPKGGGLSATFGGFSTNLLGAQRTTDILEKGTWYLAIFLIGLSLISEFFTKSNSASGAQDQGYFKPPQLPGAGTQPPADVSNANWSNTAWPFGGPVTEAR